MKFLCNVHIWPIDSNVSSYHILLL